MCWVIIRYISWQVYGILVLVSASQTQISLCHNSLLGCQIILRFCTEHDNFGFGTLVLHINAEKPVRLDFRNLYYLFFPYFMFENLELTYHLTSIHDEFIVAPSAGWKPPDADAASVCLESTQILQDRLTCSQCMHVVWQPALSLCAIPFNGIPPLVSCIPRSANQFNA